MVRVYSTVFGQRIRLPQMGSQDPKDVARDTARDLSGLVGGLVALKGDATHWLTDPTYAIKKIKHTSRPNAVLTGVPPHLMAQYG